MQRNWRKALRADRARMSPELEEALKEAAGADQVRLNEPMARHTTWRIGGPADALVTVNDEVALERVLAVVRRFEAPCVVLGGGANTLVLDGGVRGVVLMLGRGFSGIEVSEDGDHDLVQAGAAAGLAQIIKKARERGWRGVAPLAGTPGSVGGALRMNAGDRDVWIGNFVVDVDIMLRDGTRRTLARERIGYGYRRADFPPGSVILKGRFQFARGDASAVRAEIDAHIEKRKLTQPLHLPSGGSVFRNPENGFAGELIERVGLKGVRLNQAQISDKHANFIVNLGEARARDVLALIRTAKQRVLEETGIKLEEEVRIIGEPLMDMSDG